MKGKIVSGVMLTLLLLAMAVGVTATDWDGTADDPTPAQAIWVDPKNTSGLNIGNTFVVDILVNITDPPGSGTGLYGFQYRLKWNSTVLDAVEITTHTDKIPSNDLLSGWTSVFIVENETGVTAEGLDYHSYSVSATAGTAFTGVDSLCTYKFKIVWQPEPELGRDFCALLDIYDDILVDDTATPIAHTTVDGRYCVPGFWLVHNINTGLNYVAIQEAINAPQTLNGHTIRVDAWTYYEHVVVNKSIWLIGEDPTNPVVDGSDTGNVIEIRANNVVVRYFTLRNAGNHGMLLDRINNCIIRNNNIRVNDGDGIYLNESSGNTFSTNTIANNGDGISLDESSDNTISGNTIRDNNLRGVALWNSSDNTISGNTIRDNGDGIELFMSLNNTISGNTITDNSFGVWLEESSNNTISGNTITEYGSFGIVLYTSSSNNTVSGNTVTNSSVGIWLNETSNNSLSGNTMNGNVVNFGGVSGYELGHFMHSIDVSNLVNGKPVYYLVNQTNLVMNATTHPQVGYLGLVNCGNITAEGLTLTDNGEGLLLAYTNNSRIADNNIANNQHGIELFMSLNNTISGNTITDNGDGLYLEDSSNNTLSENTIEDSSNGIQLHGSSNNSIYHNDFLDNTVQVNTEDSVNIWDDGYPSGGNFWSDHNPPDIYSGPYQNETGSDNIGDDPYIIDGNNTDRYPLIYPYNYVPTIDLNNDGVINIIDIVTVGLAFDTRPGDPKWNPYADINQDGVVNIIDVVMVGLHFDETYP